jgi:tRNA(Leu) C34 or U34 (ribose-2'-O)-methylase TrmL
VVFPTRRQAPLTPSAIKASAGAVEHLLLSPVDDLAAALADLHGHGLRIAGSEAGAPLTARQADLRGPLVIVVGSEGQGLGPSVRKRCDLLMRIPMRGAIGSLNAAVAGSILLFEAVAQRDPDGRQKRVPPSGAAATTETGAAIAPDTSGDVSPDLAAPEPIDHVPDDAPATGPGPVDPPKRVRTRGARKSTAQPGDRGDAASTGHPDGPPDELASAPTPAPDDDLLPGAPQLAPRKARKRRSPDASS